MIEHNANFELPARHSRERGQAEQDWLRAEQNEQDWLRVQSERVARPRYEDPHKTPGACASLGDDRRNRYRWLA